MRKGTIEERLDLANKEIGRLCRFVNDLVGCMGLNPPVKLSYLPPDDPADLCLLTLEADSDNIPMDRFEIGSFEGDTDLEAINVFDTVTSTLFLLKSGKEMMKDEGFEHMWEMNRPYFEERQKRREKTKEVAA